MSGVWVCMSCGFRYESNPSQCKQCGNLTAWSFLKSDKSDVGLLMEINDLKRRIEQIEEKQ